MKPTLLPITVSLSVITLLTGCAQVGGTRYSPTEVGVTLNSERVRITNIRKVLVQSGEPGVGTIGGGIAGGIAGSMVGSGKASALAAVGGALAGLFIGNQADRRVGADRAIEITFVRMDGRESMIVQPDNGEAFVPGQEVRLITGGSSSRIAY